MFRNRPEDAPEWITPADQHMLQVEDHQAVPWAQFSRLIAERSEMDVGAAEMRRYEDCTVS
jgi:hypothetical protein